MLAETATGKSPVGRYFFCQGFVSFRIMKTAFPISKTFVVFVMHFYYIKRSVCVITRLYFTTIALDMWYVVQSVKNCR